MKHCIPVIVFGIVSAGILNASSNIPASVRYTGNGSDRATLKIVNRTNADIVVNIAERAYWHPGRREQSRQHNGKVIKANSTVWFGRFDGEGRNRPWEIFYQNKNYSNHAVKVNIVFPGNVPLPYWSDFCNYDQGVVYVIGVGDIRVDPFGACRAQLDVNQVLDAARGNGATQRIVVNKTLDNNDARNVYKIPCSR